MLYAGPGAVGRLVSGVAVTETAVGLTSWLTFTGGARLSAGRPVRPVGALLPGAVA